MKFAIGDIVHVGVMDWIGMVHEENCGPNYTFRLKGFGEHKEAIENHFWSLKKAHLIDPLQSAILKANGAFE